MILEYLHPVWAIAVFAVAILSAQLLLSSGARLEDPGKYATIDGLRGLLAVGVFICHVAVWFRYGTTGIWRNSPSPIYMHLGETSVVLFFMVTGFLFWGKVLDNRGKKLDWYALYRSRWFRIMPLYAAALLLLVLVVVLKSGFTLHVPAGMLAWQSFSWLTFTLTGVPSLNGFRETIPLLGVAWTLRYEWLFYLSLPLLAGLAGVRVPVPWTLFSATAVLIIMSAMFKLETEILPSFAFGMLSAHVVRMETARTLLAEPSSGFIIPLSLALTCWLFPKTAYAPGAEAILFFGFVAMACGNTLGGLLTARPIRLLGQISYSMYLLHLFVLYALFGVMIRYSGLLPISPAQHWILAMLVTPLLVGLCYITWLKIEAPGIKRGHRKGDKGT